MRDNIMKGDINRPNEWDAGLQHPTWQQVFDWLKTLDENIEVGQYEIEGKSIYAVVQENNTETETERSFEAHHRYIDVHYCLAGGEIVEVYPTANLQSTTAYDVKKDVIFYEAPSQPRKMHMTPGRFIILYPSDAHLPNMRKGELPSTKKVVVKVSTNLVPM